MIRALEGWGHLSSVRGDIPPGGCRRDHKNMRLAAGWPLGASLLPLINVYCIRPIAIFVFNVSEEIFDDKISDTIHIHKHNISNILATVDQ
ncbi:unnamed protein product [Pieris macdunnoughi]|uniref:Uncharacterized protein n=1 Tax=Pieris macdunnoughi TaxID=345717 RepID=A0A821THS9_9NEOP|nr:unnamed protein product [Pieris macdunnoughi]